MTRTVLIEIQVLSTYRRAIPNITEQNLASLRMGIKNKWIKKFNIYGMDNNSLCRAQINLQIDWNENKFQLNLGNDTVRIGEQWKNNLAVEIDEVLNSFLEIVREQRLWTKWNVSYDDWINNDITEYNKVNQALRFYPDEKINWAGNKNGVNLDINELSEMKVGFYISE